MQRLYDGIMIKCTFENNHAASLRHVTVGAVATKNNKILLVKRGPKVINPSKYAFPGGFLERGETISQAVLRELKEETRYEGKIINLFRVNDSPNRPQEDRQNVDFVFIVEVLEKTGEPSDEVSEVKWFDLDDLPPKDQFAFDHYENIQLYLQHLKKPFKLPIFGL